MPVKTIQGRPAARIEGTDARRRRRITNALEGEISKLLDAEIPQEEKETIKENSKRIASTANLSSRNPSVENIQNYKDAVGVIAKLAHFNNNVILDVVHLVEEAYPNNQLLPKVNDEIIVDNKRKESIQKELQQLNKKAIVTKGDRERDLDSLLRDKNILQERDFRPAGQKQVGVSAGYIAKEKETGNPFILKQFFKDSRDSRTKQDDDNRRDGVQELFASGLYKILLYDRAPKEELVIADEANKKSLYVRSKFFHEADTLDKFSGASNTQFNASNEQVKKIVGFEKVIAACTICGEVDYHAGNLMVQKQVDKNRKVTLVVDKIDHGRSLMEFSEDFTALTTRLDKNLREFRYMPEGKVGNLKFDVAKYSGSMKQMLVQMDEKQIDAVIDQKIVELKKSGFNPRNMRTRNNVEGGKWKEVFFNNFEEVSQYYKRVLENNLNNMKEISKELEIVAKFSNVKPEFKEGGWIKAFAESNIKDPVIFAAVHGLEIEGKNSLEWAHDNGYQVSGNVRNKKHQVNITEESWEKDKEGWYEVEKKVAKIIPEGKQQIDPVEYILSNHKTGQLSKIPKSTEEFLAKAVSENLTTARGDSYKKLTEKYSYEVKSSPVYPELGKKRNFGEVINPDMEMENAMKKFRDAVKPKKAVEKAEKIEKENRWKPLAKFKNKFKNMLGI